MTTCYENSMTRFMGYGSFQNSIFKAYEIADLENRQRLENAFPEWFVEKRTIW